MKLNSVSSVEVGRESASASTGSVGNSSILKRLRSLGPYVLVELLLPGGTLLALLLYLYNHRRAKLMSTSSPAGVAYPPVALVRSAAALLMLLLLRVRLLMRGQAVQK